MTERPAPRRELDNSFFAARSEALAHAHKTPGFLSDREARFLFLLSALSPAEGDVLEIGSFKGRSTVVLASGLKWRGGGIVHAIDPHTSPSPTDPNLYGAASTWDDFIGNIEAAQVRSLVTPYRQFSQDVAPEFTRPLRVLWIDGEHTTLGARRDLELFRARLVPGAIVAMHDVLGTWEGSLRVFCEDVLKSDQFGACGFCGSIGWAQYNPDGNSALKHRLFSALLAFPATQLIPVAASGKGLVGFNKYRYKFWRPLAPHGEVVPHSWWRSLDYVVNR